MGKKGLQGALNSVLDTKVAHRVVGLLKEHLGPQTEVVVNRVGRTAAPTVAKLHAWCESCAPTGASSSAKLRTKKTVTKTTTVTAE